MNASFLLVITVLAFSISSVKSQFPNQNPKSPADSLKEMKANNAALLDKQDATIRTLEGLQKTSQQIKIFSKRA